MVPSYAGLGGGWGVGGIGRGGVVIMICYATGLLVNMVVKRFVFTLGLLASLMF